VIARVDIVTHALVAAGLAAKMVADYAATGGSALDLFTAFAGIVSARDHEVGGQCLLALEEAILNHRKGSMNGHRHEG
jgi:hypothetical protein